MKVILPNKTELEATRAFKTYIFESDAIQLAVSFVDTPMEDIVDAFTTGTVDSITIVRNGFKDITYDNIKVTNIHENIDNNRSAVTVTFEMNK